MADVESLSLGKAGGVHLELVVLRGDGDFPAPHVHHRVVPTMVAEAKAAGACSGRLADQLMTQADTEQGDPADQCAGDRDRRLKACRIARPIGEDDTVRLARENGFDASVIRHHVDGEATRAQRAQDVPLDAEVDQHQPHAGPLSRYVMRNGGVDRLVHVDERPGDLFDQVLLLKGRDAAGSRHQRFEVRRVVYGHDHPTLGAGPA